MRDNYKIPFATAECHSKFQIETPEGLVLNESQSGDITVTLTIPFACIANRRCTLDVVSYIPPDDVLNLGEECAVSSLAKVLADGEPCSAQFDNLDPIPVSKNIPVTVKASGNAKFIQRNFGVFLMTSAGNADTHPFMHNKLVGVVRVSYISN